MNGHDLEKNDKSDIEIPSSSRAESCERLSMESYHSSNDHVCFRENFYFHYSQSATEYVTIELSNKAIFIHAEGELKKCKHFSCEEDQVYFFIFFNKKEKLNNNNFIFFLSVFLS